MKYLILDVSNLLYRTFYANKDEEDTIIAGLAMHSALTMMQKFYREYQPDKIVMCLDRPSWRKSYTKSEKCISGKIYKGNRVDKRSEMAPKERQKYEAFLDHLHNFEELMIKHTSVICLVSDDLEADDLVAGFVQLFSSSENEIIVVSTDKDFIQLLGYQNVKLVNPADGNQRTLKEWDGDAELFLFEKCIRGDAGDNVQSAYPRVRKTRIIKAWNDPIERVNLMHSTWTNHENKTFMVKDLFKENQLLMDLRKQPEKYRKLIVDTINATVENPGEYSFFNFIQFLGKFELKKMIESSTNFTGMLSK